MRATLLLFCIGPGSQPIESLINHLFNHSNGEVLLLPVHCITDIQALDGERVNPGDAAGG